MIKVGLVGLGRRGSQHLTALLEDSEVEVYAFSPHSRNAKFRDRVHFVDSYGDLLSIPDLRGVVVASPDVFHHDQILDATKKNLSVLVEKPSVTSLREIDDLLDRDVSGVWVGYDRRHLREIDSLKQLFEKRLFGKLRDISIRIVTDVSTSLTYTDNLLLNIGSHYVDFVQYLCGDLHALAAQFVKRNGWDDFGHALLETSDGAPVALGFHFSTPPFPELMESEIVCVFEFGSLVLRNQTLVLIDYRTSDIKENALSYGSTTSAFLSILCGNQITSLCPLREDRRNISLIESLYALAA